MPRVKLIQNKEDVAPEHHALFDELAALRGRVSGPSTVVLHSPGLAGPWNQISEYLHSRSVVEAADAELAILVTARAYDCGYIWAAHVPNAQKAGVSEHTISALRERRSLEGLPAREAGIAHYVQQLLTENRIESDVFDPLLQAHGPRWIVDLSSWVGRYAALAGILNAFEVLPAADADQLPSLPVAPAPSLRRHTVRPPLPAQRIRSIASREEVAEAEKPIYDSVSEGRGSVRGPFALLMYSPELCQAIINVSNYMRHDSPVTPRLRELATIAAAREKDCPFVWAAHASAARKEGIADATVVAVRDRSDLGALDPTERDIVQYTRDVLSAHRVPQLLFDRMLGEHGVTWLVDLTALIGHYNAISSLLNSIEVSPAAGAEPLPLG